MCRFHRHLDKDTSRPDYVYVNSTHLIFNLSSSGVQYVSLGGSDLSVVPESVSIFNQEIPGTNCYVTINGTTNIVDTIEGSMDFSVWCALMEIVTDTLPTTISQAKGWDGNYWYFNYTDGSSSAAPPPIVWMKPEWIITSTLGQILNFTRTIDGDDIYLKYIYVVHGYWLRIEKNITNVGEDSYRIYTYVENIGNGWTPQFEKVTVYDFVPNDFTPYAWSLSPNQNMSVGTIGSEFYGTSYVWDIGWKEGMNSSLGPSRGPHATGWQNYSWNVSYYVNGTGPYRITQLYIVGLDPLKVDGAFVSPLISVMTGIKSHSRELLYVGIVLFLVLINIANLLITHRINRKLDNVNHSAPENKKPEK